MSAKRNAHPPEKRLTNRFCRVLRGEGSPWGPVQVLKEFDYGRGRTDVIAIHADDTLFAFELKVVKWTLALHQAYRNTCFAHQSYVVLPELTARRALRHGDEFARRSVGLCYITARELVVALPAPQQQPIHPWLTQRVRAAARA